MAIQDLILYLASFLLIYTFTRNFLHKIKNLPPSPYPPLPAIGHLHLLKRPLHRTLSNLAARHGPVLFLWFGSRPVVVVSSSSPAEECLSKNDVTLANRPRLTVGKHVGYNYTSLAWAPYGDQWRKLRRISAVEVLSSGRLQALGSIRTEETKSTLRRLVEKSRGVDGPAVVEMRSLIFELTLNVMMRMIAGKRYYGDEDVADSQEARRFREITAETARLGGAMFVGDFIPALGVLGVGKGKERELVELHRNRDGFVQGLIDEHKREGVKSGSCDTTKTMIGALLKLQEKEPENYPDEVIRGVMIVLLIGATETTVNTLEWALTLLLNHSDIIKKIQIEIDIQIGNNRLLDESDVSNLPYLCNTIDETLRLYPPLPLSIPHESSEDCTIGGYRIPRGTMLVLNLWGIHHDPKAWANPERFDPERFRGRDGLEFMPFGAGRRACPGEGLAMRMVGLVLGSLVQCFDWDRAGEEMVDLDEGVGVSLFKARPLVAKCSPRPSCMGLLSQI